MSSTRNLLALSLLSYLSTAAALYTPYNFTGAVSLKAAGYTLRDSYTSGNFFNSFDFFTGADPTHGYVDYKSQSAASQAGLINSNNGQVYMGVDYTTTNPTYGRASVRVTSKKSYNHGLFIADIAHMPGSACGIWPAYWMFGPNWPSSGEIDILEGVNRMDKNAITLHTAAGCNINIAGSQSGTTLSNTNCNAAGASEGCSAKTQAPFGNSFNSGGGGVYATQWESSGIYVWFFPRGRIPADIASGHPVTSNWGLPHVAFNGGGSCNIDSFFKDQNIVFDTTFCGDWAGNVFANQCPGMGSCQSYVGANPGAFREGYWTVNSVKVYQF